MKEGADALERSNKSRDFPVGERVLGPFANIGLSVVQSWIHFSALCSWELKSESGDKRKKSYIEVWPGPLLLRRCCPA